MQAGRIRPSAPTPGTAVEPMPRLTGRQWLICIAAGIGFAFDLYESLMNTLVVGPILTKLGGLTPGSAEFVEWVGWFFYIPALSAGLFGLLGGYLTDLFGRRRVLVGSILLYSGSAAAAGLSHTLGAVLFFRCTTMIGVSVEAVAATAWVAELFSHPRQRELALGYSQACYALGGVMVSAAYYFCVSHAASLPALAGGHDAWRYTLVSGLFPAIPLLILRPFLPESPLWLARQKGGRRPSLPELFRPQLRRETLLAALAWACVIAIPAGALQQSPRILPGVAEVAHLTSLQVQQWVSLLLVGQELGSIAGRLAFPLVVNRWANRRRLLQVILVAMLALVPAVFLLGPAVGLLAFAVGMFLSQALFNVLHSFWGNYLPRLFPTFIRGTGESFAMNIGGRVLGTAAAIVSTRLATASTAPTAGLQLAQACGLTVTIVLVVFLIASTLLRDLPSEELPE